MACFSMLTTEVAHGISSATSNADKGTADENEVQSQMVGVLSPLGVRFLTGGPPASGAARDKLVSRASSLLSGRI